MLAVRSAALSVARPDSGDDNLVAGHRLEYKPADDHPRLNPTITPPDDSSPQPMIADGSTLQYPHTEFAGQYTINWKDSTGKDEQHRFAVSFAKTASDLEPLGEQQLIELTGSLRPQVVHYHAGQLAAASPGREIWRVLATGLLALLVVESVFAFWVGREK